MNDHALSAAVDALADVLQTKSLTVTVAESCTGGLLAKLLTDRAGSSAYFEQGWITYSNAAKIHRLGVSQTDLDRHGAVSAEVVAAMARGALERSGAQLAVAISGTAGPDGGTPEKPVGTVWFGFAGMNLSLPKPRTEKQVFAGDRDAVRRQAAHFALRQLTDLAGP